MDCIKNSLAKSTEVYMQPIVMKILQLKNIFSLLQNDSIATREKIFNTITSISMVLLTIGSLIAVRCAINPIAVVMISLSWVALALYSLGFYIYSKETKISP